MGLGEATLVGSLSVPPSWPVAAREIEAVAMGGPPGLTDEEAEALMRIVIGRRAIAHANP